MPSALEKSPSFIESPFDTRVEYDAYLKLPDAAKPAALTAAAAKKANAPALVMSASSSMHIAGLDVHAAKVAADEAAAGLGTIAQLAVRRQLTMTRPDLAKLCITTHWQRYKALTNFRKKRSACYKIQTAARFRPVQKAFNNLLDNPSCLADLGLPAVPSPLPTYATAVDLDLDKSGSAMMDVLGELLKGSADSSAAPAPEALDEGRLGCSQRGLTLSALRALHAFYGAHGGLQMGMAAVCKDAEFAASVVNLTKRSGLSLAEKVLLTSAQAGVADASDGELVGLVGPVTSFFSSAGMGGSTPLENVLEPIIRTLERLGELESGAPRRVWIDIFCASPFDVDGYQTKREGMDGLFDMADQKAEMLVYLSPLFGDGREWAAPPHPFLLPERGEPPPGWVRSGPTALADAWCLLEIAMTLSRGSPLHAVVSTADARAHASYMSETMEERDRDQFDRLCSSIDVRDAQISEADDRGHVLEQVASLLDGGLAAINTAVLQALSTWMRSEAFVALKRLPALERGFSPVCVNLANHLEVNVDWAPSAEVLWHYMVCVREQGGHNAFEAICGWAQGRLNAHNNPAAALPLLRAIMEVEMDFEAAGMRLASKFEPSVATLLVLCLVRLGELDEAEQLTDEVARVSEDWMRQIEADNKVDDEQERHYARGALLSVKVAQADLWRRRGRTGLEGSLDDVLEQARSIYGASAALHIEATAARLVEDDAAATAQLRVAVERMREFLGPDHPTTLYFESELPLLPKEKLVELLEEGAKATYELISRSHKVMREKAEALSAQGQALLSGKSLDDFLKEKGLPASPGEAASKVFGPMRAMYGVSERGMNAAINAYVEEGNTKVEQACKMYGEAMQGNAPSIELATLLKVLGKSAEASKGLADRVRAQIRKAQQQHNWREERAEFFFKQEFERVLDQASLAADTSCAATHPLTPPFATAQVIGNVRSALGVSELAMDRCFQLHQSDAEVSALIRAMRVAGAFSADIHHEGLQKETLLRMLADSAKAACALIQQTRTMVFEEHKQSGKDLESCVEEMQAQFEPSMEYVINMIRNKHGVSEQAASAALTAYSSDVQVSKATAALRAAMQGETPPTLPASGLKWHLLGGEKPCLGKQLHSASLAAALLAKARALLLDDATMTPARLEELGLCGLIDRGAPPAAKEGGPIADEGGGAKAAEEVAAAEAEKVEEKVSAELEAAMAEELSCAAIRTALTAVGENAFSPRMLAAMRTALGTVTEPTAACPLLVEFTAAEWTEMGGQAKGIVLRASHYVEVGGHFFAPAAPLAKGLLKEVMSFNASKLEEELTPLKELLERGNLARSLAASAVACAIDRCDGAEAGEGFRRSSAPHRIVDPSSLQAVQASISRAVYDRFGVTDEQVVAAVEMLDAKNDSEFQPILRGIAAILKETLS